MAGVKITAEARPASAPALRARELDPSCTVDVIVADATPLAEPDPLDEVGPGLTPPQSFRYLPSAVAGRSHGSVTSGRPVAWLCRQIPARHTDSGAWLTAQCPNRCRFQVHSHLWCRPCAATRQPINPHGLTRWCYVAGSFRRHATVGQLPRRPGTTARHRLLYALEVAGRRRAPRDRRRPCRWDRRAAGPRRRARP